LWAFDEAYNTAAAALPISDSHDIKAAINDSQKDIKVAILDTGIDAGHHKFHSCINSRKSFLPDAHDFLDPDGHGTHMAGLVHHVAPNAKLLIGRIFDNTSYNQVCAAEVCLF
jgi:subtilisin family serine protease